MSWLCNSFHSFVVFLFGYKLNIVWLRGGVDSLIKYMQYTAITVRQKQQMECIYKPVKHTFRTSPIEKILLVKSSAS